MSDAGRPVLRRPRPEDLKAVSAWMEDPAVHRWFDFGQGRQQVSATALSIMARSPNYCMRIFSEPDRDDAGGVVVLSEVLHPFESAHFWVIRQPHRPARPGLTAAATRALLQTGFGRLGRRTVNAWVVESNERSLRLLDRVGFERIGLQRECHRVDGQLQGRVHLELLLDRFRSTQPAGDEWWVE